MRTDRIQRRFHVSPRLVVMGMAVAVPMLAMGGCPPPGNQTPVASNQQVTTAFETAVEITLVATDADADALTFTIAAGPSNGTLSDISGDQVTYTPAARFSGPDSFTFTAGDGMATSDPATVSITVQEDTGGIVGDEVITENTTVASLTVPAGTTTEIMNNAVVTVTGDATIDGTVASDGGRLTLIVAGSLTVNGSLSAIDASVTELPGDAPLNQQPAGIHLVVAGGVTFASTSSVQSNGPIVITDDAAVLEQTPDTLFDQVEDVSGDDLPTLVPLPPDDPVFDNPAAKAAPAGVSIAGAAAPPVVVSGTWPPAGAPAPPGDKPVVVFRFNGPRDLNLNNWTVNGPNAPDQPENDGSANPGTNASGQNGRNGLRLNIWNNGGAINIVNAVVINLPDGGDGGDAAGVCASAAGGNGGNSGNFRMTASGGINLTNGTLTLNPGVSGRGGHAAVTQGNAAGSGCPGGTGAAATATGGNAADNRKRLLVRGNVTGLANMTIGDLIAGDGGDATAEACDGGPGIACCDGGPGGVATSNGGRGGDASLSVSNTAVNVSDVIAGDGGEATATGGDGGDGGDCKFGDAGDGGAGGLAMATSGDGGNATGGQTAAGGDTPDATATGGTGGAGGDSGFGTPGAGGAEAVPTAAIGTPGTGNPPGSAGTATPNTGPMGPPGGVLGGTVVYCITFNAVQPSEGGAEIPPGVQTLPVFADDNTTQIGTIDIEFRDVPGAQYLRGTTPVEHVGLPGGMGAIDFKVDTLQLTDGQFGVIGGLRTAVLFANGVDDANPLVVQALDADGQEIDSRQFGSVPGNFDNPQDPQFFDALFNVEQSVATFRITVPQVSFVTPFQVYLLDP